MSFSIESEITDPSALWPFTCFPPFVFYRLDCYRCFHFSRYPFFQISRYYFRRDLNSVSRDCGRFYFEFIRHWLCSWSIFILWGSIYKKMSEIFGENFSKIFGRLSKQRLCASRVWTEKKNSAKFENCQNRSCCIPCLIRALLAQWVGEARSA